MVEPVVGHCRRMRVEHVLRLGHNHETPCTPRSVATQMGGSLIFAEHFGGFLSLVADGGALDASAGTAVPTQTLKGGNSHKF